MIKSSNEYNFFIVLGVKEIHAEYIALNDNEWYQVHLIRDKEHQMFPSTSITNLWLSSVSAPLRLDLT